MSNPVAPRSSTAVRVRGFLCGVCALAAVAAVAGPAQPAATLWKFDRAANRLASSTGPAILDYFDPDGTGWGRAHSAFGKASAFGLPPMAGGDPDVMRFPACTPRQGYRVRHASAANGPYGESHGLVSNYTLILDLLYPAASTGRWRPLLQTHAENGNDAELFVAGRPGAGVGTREVQRGAVSPGAWHRIAIVMQAAPEEGKCQLFVDGRFAGGIGTTGSGLEIRYTLEPQFLLFTTGLGESAAGYASSLAFVDRAMPMEEIETLGGPHAAGALTAGPAAPPLPRAARPVRAIGHRGGAFCCAPDNTLAGVRRALRDGTPVIEIDTRLSADGTCVLMHDPTVDRTTDGTGAVASLTVAELKKLDAGSWFAPEFAGERVPTAAEVMAEARGKLILYFDLKVRGQANAIAAALAETGFEAADCWFWTYGDSSEAAALRARIPEAKIIGSDPPANWAGIPDFLASMRAQGIHGFDLGVGFVDRDPGFVRAARAAGFVVSVHTVLDPESMLRYALAGVDFIETDFPQVVRRIQP